MKTLILSTIIKILIPIFLGFAFYMFFRGHNQPGGGFIAGLIAAIPFMIYAMAFGVEKTNAIFKLRPMFMAILGLLLASVSGIYAMLMHKPFMTSLWIPEKVAIIGKVGTPILFDLGVFFLVAGVVLKITFLLTKE
jgi:multicomponent Na+:H+ antiporter subunit B